MRDVVIIGAGPAGLIAAEHLAQRGRRVTVIDRMGAPARKFLLAGRGGLNLTHSEPLDQFVTRYREAAPFLMPLIRAFPPKLLIDWCETLGQQTFTGSSGRVFPKTMKASPLLRAWLKRLDGLGVELRLKTRWTGFDNTGSPVFRENDGPSRSLPVRTILLALGGASWPRLGSDGSWTDILRARSIQIAPLVPANCGFTADWTPYLQEKHAGSPLKRLRLTVGSRSGMGESVMGEAIITDDGLEGGAVYALSAEIRETIRREGTCTIHLDLRPDLTAEKLAKKLSRPRKKASLATFLRKAVGLTAADTALLREHGPLPESPDALAALIKAVPVNLTGYAPMERAISSAGGICLDEFDGGLMLKKMPGVFAAGEMLDWEAPTGGYLLQACFATGVAAAKGIDRWLQATATKEPST